jgi:hypothetical protein
MEFAAEGVYAVLQADCPVRQQRGGVSGGGNSCSDGLAPGTAARTSSPPATVAAAGAGRATPGRSAAATAGRARPKGGEPATRHMERDRRESGSRERGVMAGSGGGMEARRGGAPLRNGSAPEARRGEALSTCVPEARIAGAGACSARAGAWSAEARCVAGDLDPEVEGREWEQGVERESVGEKRGGGAPSRPAGGVVAVAAERREDSDAAGESFFGFFLSASLLAAVCSTADFPLAVIPETHRFGFCTLHFSSCCRPPFRGSSWSSISSSSCRSSSSCSSSPSCQGCWF